MICLANIIYLLFQPSSDLETVLFRGLQYVLMLALLTAPIVLRKRFLLNIPLVLVVAIAVFAFTALILGDGLDFYGKYPWWDSLLHMLSGVVLSFIALWVMHAVMPESYRIVFRNKYFMALYLLMFTLAVGGLWEICEYTFDDLFGTNTQQFMETTSGSMITPEDIPLQGHEALRDKVYTDTQELIATDAATDELKAAAEAWIAARNDADQSKVASEAYLAELQKIADNPIAAGIIENKNYLTKKSFWIFGGDGWAYDIGYGGLDHVLASGHDVNVFVFDTEVYSNTGGQASKASNIGQVAQFAAAGKDVKKKSLAELAMSYGYVYVAQIAMGAKPAQTIKAIAEAEAYPGPSLIIGYSPCEMHSIKGGMKNCQAEMKRAVDCGYWNLFRFNPAAETGKKFTLDSKEPAGGYQEFLMNEARYSRLTREFPERAAELFERNEKAAMERYQHLLKLKEMYVDA